MRRKFDDLTFKFVCQIEPEREDSGKIKQYMPQDQYAKCDITPLNAYGAGLFCRFRIPKDMPLTGVYIITIDDTPHYVGECVDLSNRYNTGYGQISARNCYKGGQSTNCRLNNLIYQSIEADKKIELWFLKTNDRLAIESRLIANLSTQDYWNRKA